MSLFALQDETQVDQYDSKYNERIPLGCLINLIQKGILYCEEDELVDLLGQLVPAEITRKFNLFDSLEKDKTSNPTTNVRDVTQLETQLESKEVSPLSETFTTVLTKSFSFASSITNHWNPRSSSVFAFGKRDSTCNIVVLDGSLHLSSTLVLEHPSFATASNDITLILWSPVGDLLLTASESGELRLWSTDGKLKNVMMLHSLPVINIKWLQRFILTMDTSRSIVWDSLSGLAILHLEDATGGIDGCFIDETKIAIPLADHSILIYDLPSSQLLSKLAGHSDNVSTINYSHDLKLLLTSSDDLSIRIWKGESINSTQIILGHSQLITYCNWLISPDFHLTKDLVISTSLDGSVRIWNILNGDLLFLATNPGSTSILQAALSPNGALLVTGDIDGIVTIWDVSGQSLNKNFKPHSVGVIKTISQYQPDQESETVACISCLSWSPDSHKISISYNELESVILCI